MAGDGGQPLAPRCARCREVHFPVSGSCTAPSERGKISYHAPYRARSRSTSSGYAVDGLTWSRSGRAASSARTDGSVPACSRASGGRPVSRSAVTASRSTACWSVVRSTSARARSQGAGALLEHQVGVDVGRDLDDRVVVPRAVGVGPALDAVGPPALGVGLDHGGPGVEARVDGGHRGDPLRPVRRREDDRGVDGVVPLAEHGGADGELLADDGLGRPGAAVDDRADVLHRDPADRNLRGSRRRSLRRCLRSRGRSGRARWPSAGASGGGGSDGQVWWPGVAVTRPTLLGLGRRAPPPCRDGQAAENS